MIKLKPCQVLKDLINTNIVKLLVTKWVEGTKDKQGSISDLVNRGTGRNDRTLPSRDRNLPPRDGNLPLFTILCQYCDN